MARPSLTLEVRSAGLYLPALDLYLDPSRDVPRAFVSHAHGDHGGGFASGTVLASRETLALLGARHGTIVGAQPIDPSMEMATPAGMARITLASAGHVLGAAQLVVDHPGGRFVYTGDYRTGGGRTHAAGAPVACDTLAIESTFALPIFRWPDREATMTALVEWCRESLEEGREVLVLAYALGKAQEIIRALTDAGLEVVAHGAVFKMCEAYASLGVPVGPVRPYAEEKKRKGKPKSILVAPPRAAAQLSKGRRVAYVSGNAMVDAQVDRYRADAAFVLSDHADFDDLVATVRASGARFVYTTHGDTVPFARYLNEQGIHAEAREIGAMDEET
jgi:putative mRNA 3-end processing factor